YSVCLKSNEDKELDELGYQKCIDFANEMIKDLCQQDPVKFQEDFINVIELFKNLENQKSPTSKLSCIYVASKKIMEVIDLKCSENTTKYQFVISSDDFLPIFICCVAVSKIKNMATQINF